MLFIKQNRILIWGGAISITFGHWKEDKNDDQINKIKTAEDSLYIRIYNRLKNWGHQIPMKASVKDVLRIEELAEGLYENTLPTTIHSQISPPPQPRRRLLAGEAERGGLLDRKHNGGQGCHMEYRN